MTTKEQRADELLKAFQELGQTYTRVIASEALSKCQETRNLGCYPEAAEVSVDGLCKALYELSTEKLNAARAELLREILALFGPKPVGWFDACN